MDCSLPGLLVPHHLPKLAQVHVHCIHDVIHILWHSILLPLIFPSIRPFSIESSVCIRWPKYCSFSFSISPSKEYSGLISFKIDWFDLLVVQGTLRNLLQHHSSKASVLQCSTFFASFSNVPTFSHMPCVTVCSSSTGFPLPPYLWPCISFPLPFSLCGSHCITWFLVVANFTWVKQWKVFYLMIRNTIFEHILLLPGTHSQDWRIYLISPFP